MLTRPTFDTNCYAITRKYSFVKKVYIDKQKTSDLDMTFSDP